MIFRQMVKPLKPEHMRELSSITDAIGWNQEQYHLYLNIINRIEINLSAITRAQRRFRDQAKSSDFMHTHLCRAMRMQQQAEIVRLNNLMEMHETIIEILKADLDAFLQANYGIKPEQGWHLDLQQRALYRRPQPVKPVHTTEDIVNECNSESDEVTDEEVQAIVGPPSSENNETA